MAFFADRLLNVTPPDTSPDARDRGRIDTELCSDCGTRPFRQSDLSHRAVAQLGSAVLLASHGLLQPSPVCVPLVLRLCDPLKVACSVVCLDPVLVVHLVLGRWRLSVKRARYDSGDEDCFGLGIATHLDAKVSSASACEECRKDSTRPRAVRTARGSPYPASVADLVVRRPIWNRPPCLAHGATHYLASTA